MLKKDLTNYTKKIKDNSIKNNIKELFEWAPGIIFPLSHTIQIIDMYKDKHNREIKHIKTPMHLGLDPTTFLFFYIGNLGAFLFNRKYFSFKTWLAYILPSILEIYIIVFANELENDRKKALTYGIVMSVILTCMLLFTYRLCYDNDLSNKINKIGEYAGFLPAILFPLGILLQLIKIIKEKSIEDVSRDGWILMFVANVGCYVLTERYTNWKSISAFVLSAIFSISIVIYIEKRKSDIKDNSS